MDDQDVSPLVGVMALGVIVAGLAALAWLLVDVSQTTGGGQTQVRMSDRQVVGPPSTHRRPLHPVRTCSDAVAPRGRAGCVAS